jgi:O-antigen biosynthesis protein
MDHDKATPQELRWRIAQLETRLAEQTRINQEITQSTIWRATAPLRSLLIPLSQFKRRVTQKQVPNKPGFAPPRISYPESVGALTAQPWTAGRSHFPVVLDIHCDEGTGGSLGLRHVNVFEDGGAPSAPLVKIDLRANGNSGPFKAYGFAQPESWGVWTQSSKSRLLLWLPKTQASKYRMEIVGGLRENGSVDTAPTLLVNGKSKGKIAFSDAGLATLEMDFQAGDTALPIPSTPNNLSKAPEAKPDVSVLILNYNKPYLTFLAVQAVLSAKAALTYEILVLDNGSTPQSANVLASMDLPIRLLRLEENRFFGEGNNIAAEMARGEALLFLNNDAFIEDQVLDRLFATLTSSDEIGAVGPVFYYPDGTLQEAGAFIAKDASVYQRGKGALDIDLTQFPKISEVDYISAACLMVDRLQFLQLGGFDLRYDPAYYEDSDLCLRLLDQGFKTVLQTDSHVTHIENATTAAAENNGLANNITERHRAIFLTRWQTWLKGRDPVDLPHIKSFSVEETTNRVSIRESGQPINAAYTPYNLSQGGGERYLLSAAQTMNLPGGDEPAAIVTPTLYSLCRVNNLCRELGLPIGKLSPVAVSKLASHPTRRYIHMGNEVLPSMPGFGETNVFHCQFPFPGNLPVPSVEIGLANLATYKTVIVNSDFTRTAYLRALGELSSISADVRVIYPPVRLLSSFPSTAAIAKEKMILTIGRFSPEGHAKRQDLIIAAFKELAGAGKMEGWRLVLCGSVPNDPKSVAFFDRLTQSVQGFYVEFVISPSRSQIDDLYLRASIYVSATGANVSHPHQYHMCEHFGITVVEAMSANCLVVVAEKGGPAEIVAAMGSGLRFPRSSALPKALSTAVEAYTETGANIDQTKLSNLFSEDQFFTRWRAVWDELEHLA